MNKTEFFRLLVDNNCVILRNFENIETDLVSDNHNDIDILCKNRDIVSKALHATQKKNKDPIHYLVFVDSKQVNLDIRQVGDGYYDANWEQAILDNKKHYNNQFYIMDEENYLYTLIYHVFIQKYSVGKDYLQRISMLVAKMGMDVGNDYIELLEKYMSSKKYRYTYPEYIWGIFNIKNVHDKKLIEKSIRKNIKYMVRKLLR